MWERRRVLRSEAVLASVPSQLRDLGRFTSPCSPSVCLCNPGMTVRLYSSPGGREITHVWRPDERFPSMWQMFIQHVAATVSSVF